MLKTLWQETLANFTQDNTLVDELWTNVLLHYGAASRHYHNMDHLENLCADLIAIKDQVKDWDIMVLAVAYHDVIYNVLKQNNEEKSADYAAEKLSQLLSSSQSSLLKEFIIATKKHERSTNEDVNYFIDADLSILGVDEEAYTLYTKQIRKEYDYYPSFVYKPGRAKVVKHFLVMERIYKTDYFYNKREEKARLNLEMELAVLTGNK